MLRTRDRMDAQPHISIPTSPAMAEAQETSPKGSWKECEGRGSVVTGCLLDRTQLLPRRTHSGCGYSHKTCPPKLKPAKILAGWADNRQDSADSHWRRELILFWGCRHWSDSRALTDCLKPKLIWAALTSLSVLFCLGKDMMMGGGRAEENMGDNENRDGGRYDHMLLCTCMDFS